MTQENYIKDVQLPLELDFKALKAEGLAYIQKHSSLEWTNLNPSDPGVTILEQLCYAFTELGYCANFSIQDILTDKNGELTVSDQFYLPQDILTTAPITVDDYTKYIIDQVPSVKNAIVIPISLDFPFINGLYKVYILLHPNNEEASIISEFNAEKELETFYVLNASRNVGELFLQPKVLTPKIYTITGKLVLDSDANFDTVLSEIIQNINAYIFPDVVQTGYDKLKKAGAATNDIFNGPTLQNGWITSESIQPKKDSIQPFEITKLIQEVTGVQSISRVSFLLNNEPKTTATCLANEILSFDFSQSLLKNSNTEILHLQTQGKNILANINTTLVDELAMLQQSNLQENEVAAVQMAPNIPTGKYRDITSYFSIQNTFPEAFSVGLNATNDATPTYQVAQSRQLKGYLNLFDQLLSNQFAQLANLDKLFSFKNTISGATADLEHYNNIKTPTQKAHPSYPAPFEVFSPTYFYQSLYESVPNVAPLLRDSNVFDFGPVSTSEATLAHKSWLAYQNDPYNSYMYGLLLFMEDDTINIQRRNDLLDHLLARHGASPYIIDTLVYGTVYSGDFLKDRVILKSIYLQNLAMLSYNRTKAYNSIGAQLLSDFVLPITAEFVHQLKGTTMAELLEDLQPSDITQDTQTQRVNAKAESRSIITLYDILTKSYKKDGMFDVHRVNEEEKITQTDLLNFTTISLKLSMLLTLKPLLINYIQEISSSKLQTITQEQKALLYEQGEVLLWLVTERKGFIAIETSVLLQSGSFQVYIIQNDLYYRLDTMLNYTDFLVLSAELAKADIRDITAYLTNINASYTLTKIESEPLADTNFTTAKNATFGWTATVSWNDTTAYSIHDSLFQQSLLWIFPDFVKELNASEWQYRLSYFMETQLSIHISACPLYATSAQLKTFIPQYVSWFNANIYNASTQSIDEATVASSAAEVSTSLMQFSTKPSSTNV